MDQQRTKGIDFPRELRIEMLEYAAECLGAYPRIHGIAPDKIEIGDARDFVVRSLNRMYQGRFRKPQESRTRGHLYKYGLRAIVEEAAEGMGYSRLPVRHSNGSLYWVINADTT